MKKNLLNSPPFLGGVAQHSEGREGKDLFYKIMRITAVQILLIALTMSVSIAREGFSQAILDRTVSMELTSTTLKDALTALENQAKVKFVYSGSALELTEQVTINASGEKLGSVLDKLLEPLSIKYVVKSKVHIVLKRAKDKDGTASIKKIKPFRNASSEEDLSVKEAPSAEITVTGTVTDEQSQSLPGVNVVEKGTTNGTTTDANGKYSLNIVDGNAVLVFSFIGFSKQEVAVSGRSVIDVVLAEEIKSLEEVVVIGYGTVKKSDLTGSISTVSSEDFERVPATDPLQALQGRATGLRITSTSGMPGAPSAVLIRGVQSINGTTSPIYVVDGLITENINNVNPQDIESVSVLKDASATAIYGARASNGVILITTKRGSKGSLGPEITFHYFAGIQQLSNLKLEVLNAEQYVELYTEAYENAGITGTDLPWTADDLAYYGDTDEDWLGRVLQTGVLQSYNLSVGGGSERSNYYVSAGYVDHKGMIIGSDYEKMTIRFNSDYMINDWITFENSIQLTATGANGNAGGNSINTTGLGIGNTDIFSRAATKPPITKAYEANGDYGKIHSSSLEHISQSPIWQAKESETNLKNKSAFGSLGLRIKLLEGLEFNPRLNYEFDLLYQSTFIPAVNPAWGWEGATVNSVDKYQRQTLHWIADGLLNYQKTFGDHSISALAGYSWEENYWEDLYGHRIGTPNNSIRLLAAGDPVNSLANNNDASDWAFVSLFGRVNYSFKSKYLLTGSIRRDGSSRLGTGNKYGVFPSGSVAWRISQEPFLQDVSLISDLKLRASIGTVGNVQSLGTYATLASLSSRNYLLNNAPAQGYTLASAVNSDLKWETTTKKNIGLDGSFYNDKLYGSVDYFIENTFDLLFRKPIPLSTGLEGSPFINAGEVRNTGIELEIGYRNISTNDWSYDVNFNFSHVKNKVVDLAGQNLRTSGLIEGYPVRSYFGYKSNGLIYSAEDLAQQDYSPGTFTGKGIGDIWILDIDGPADAEGNFPGVSDGKVDANDRTIIGKRYPDFIYGLMSTVSYKNWTLQLQLQGVQGIDNSIYGSSLTFFSGLPRNQNAMILDRYHPTKNPDGEMPILNYADRGKNYNFGLVLTDWSLRDASYLRVRNVNLNYNLPETLLSNYGIQGLSAYVSIQNLYTFTKFPGTEVDTVSDPLTGLPQPRTWTFGVKASF